MDFQQLKENANRLRKQKQFDAAASIYEEIIQNYPQESSDWDRTGYASCLRQLGKVTESLEVLRQVYVRLKNNPTADKQLFSWCRNEYGRCIYDMEIKTLDLESDINEVKLFRAADAIVLLTTQEEFSPFERTVFFVVDYLDKRPNPNYRLIFNWLNKLNPHILSSQPRSAKNPDHVDKTYPSPKEKWYSVFAKTLLELRSYSECVEICNQALSEFSEFHYSYDVWFKWYRGKSLAALNRHSEALVDFQAIQRVKKDFFVDYEIARSYSSLDNINEALIHAVKAALVKGPLEYKWEVFLLIGKLLISMGNNDLAYQHVQLAAKIREEKNWKRIPPELSTMIRTLQVSLDGVPDSKALSNQLAKYWQSIKMPSKTNYSGVISRIHGNQKSGHIRSSDGQEYFFSVRSVPSPQAYLQTGLAVRFNLKEEINKNTGIPEMHAVDIVMEDS